MMKWLTSRLLPRGDNKKITKCRQKTGKRLGGPRSRLTQSEVFFPFAYHAIVANHVVSTGICLVLSWIVEIFDRCRSCNPHLKKVRRSSTLFASIILVSEEYHLPIIKDCDWPVTEWGNQRPPSISNQFGYDCDSIDSITRSTILVLPQTQKIAGGNIFRFQEKKSLPDKTLWIQMFSDSKFPL